MGAILYWPPARAAEAQERYEKYRRVALCTVPVLLFPKIERRSPAEVAAAKKRMAAREDWTRPRSY